MLCVKMVKVEMNLKLINFFIVGLYWITVADLGQIGPTKYPPLLQVYRQLVNFSEPKEFLPSNTIFRNTKLFTSFTSFLRDNVFPFLNSTSPQFASVGAKICFNTAPQPSLATIYAEKGDRRIW